MKMRSILLAATLMSAPALVPAIAMAQPVTGPYVSAGLGYNIMGSRSVKTVAVPALNLSGNADAHAVFHNGFTGEASVGYGFGNGFRVELEGDYFDNQLSKVDVGAGSTVFLPGQVTASGKEKKYGAMVNALYDFDVGSPYVFPFVGAGVGYQFVHLDGVSVPAVDGGPSEFSINQTKGGLAYQAIAGVSFPIPGAPGLSANVQYRYMRTNGRTYAASYNLGKTPQAASVKLGDDSNNMVLVGLTYQLFPPAPPAPPAPAPAPVATPAPAPARTYLVFFDWNKYNLTPRADQIIAQAADASRTTHVTSLNVNGYTDTSGTPAYNEKLSFRRADTVAAKLVADGVPKQDIVIKGFGETHLLVPTGPGVREPQNRRVEIILH